MQAGFEGVRGQRFGFVPVERRLVVEAVAGEFIGATGEVADPVGAVEPGASEAVPLTHVAMYSGGARRDAPLYDRDTLLPGQKIDGPAIVREATATPVVEQGWQAVLATRGHVVLTSVVPRPKSEAIGNAADPGLTEVFHNPQIDKASWQE